MKTGDIINVYTDPGTMKILEGQARLIEFKGNLGKFQQWMVEFLDCPGYRFERLIKSNV